MIKLIWSNHGFSTYQRAVIGNVECTADKLYGRWTLCITVDGSIQYQEKQPDLRTLKQTAVDWITARVNNQQKESAK